jgi:hypothetical protein
MKRVLTLLLSLTCMGIAPAIGDQGFIQSTVSNRCRVSDVCATAWIGRGHHSCEATNGFDIRTTLVIERGISIIEVDWVNHTGRALPRGTPLVASYYCES